MSDPWAGTDDENAGSGSPESQPRSYSRMNKGDLQTELRSRNVEFDEGDSNKVLIGRLRANDVGEEFDPGLFGDEDPGADVDQDGIPDYMDPDVNYAALPPDSPMKTGHYVQSNQGAPQIRVRTPEGELLDVDADQEKDLKEVGFEVVAGSDELGPNGTRTTSADQHWVEFGKQERRQAERVLGRR